MVQDRRVSGYALQTMVDEETLNAWSCPTRVRCGRHRTFVHGPALTNASARETALRQLAEDFYGGSLASLAEAIADMFAADMLARAAMPNRRTARVAAH